MRNLLILILGAAVVWLLIERNRLTDEANAAVAQIAEKDKELAEMRALVPGTRTIIQPGGTRTIIRDNPGKSSWLNEHLEKGAKALDPKAR